MTVTASPDQIRRLAFVRHLHELGVKQSRHHEISGATAVLLFHDAIELFLQLAAEALGESSNKWNFLDYWDRLTPQLETPLPHKSAMGRLNKSRVNIKHHGVLPAKIDIESFRVSSTDFLDEAIQQIFGLRLEQLYLSEFVEPEEARKRIKDAEDKLSKGDLLDASGDIAIAFEIVIGWAIGSLNQEQVNHYLTFPPRLRDILQGEPPRELVELDMYFHNVSESIQQIQHSVELLSLGLDFKKVFEFKRNLPHVTPTVTGSWVIQGQPMADAVDEVLLSKKIGFVIDCSMELQSQIGIQASLS